MKKNIRQSMQQLLKLPVCDNSDIDELRQVGLKAKKPTNSELIALKLFEAARRGELSALKEVLRLESESEGDAERITIVDDIGGKNDA